MFGDCPIFFSLGSFLGFVFGSLVVLLASLGLGLFVESSLGWGFGMCLPDDWSCSFEHLDC